MFLLFVLSASLQSSPAELRPVPEPRLAGLEDAVREQVRSINELLRELTAKEGSSSADVAEAFGAGGQLYFTYDLPASAEACFHNARLLAPADFRWPYYLGALHQKAGRLESAASFYREALSLRPDDVPALFHLGDVQKQLNRLDEAEELFGRTLLVDSSCTAARAELGQVAFLRRDFSRAVDLIRAALDAAPEADRLHYPLAMAYRQLGEPEEAQRHLELSGSVGLRVHDPLLDQLLELRRGERVHTIRGKLAFRFGRFEEAAFEFEKAVKASPESYRVRVNLGSALAKLERIDAAIQQYNEAIRLEPRAENAHFNLGYLLARAGDSKGAARHLRAAIEIDPEDHQAYVELAHILEREGAFSDARRHYTRAVELVPEHGRARLGRARTLAAEGSYREALAQLEAAHRKLPTDGGIAQALARLLASSPDATMRDARRALDLAQRVFDARPSAYHAETLAMALAELGRCEDASRWQRAGIDLARRSSRGDLVARLSESLVRYENGPPCAYPTRDP